MSGGPRTIRDLPPLPPRPVDMHKGQAGRVAIIAGSRGMSGAAVLAGLSALRGGAGLVRVCTPASVLPIIAAGEPCLMTQALPETDQGQADGSNAFRALDLNWPTVVALGPGLGTTSPVQEFVTQVVTRAQVPLVLDADGINCLAGGTLPQWWKQRAPETTVVTPHPGEMKRLRSAAGLSPLDAQDDDGRIRIAHEYAQLTGCVVVLKGHHTVVATASSVYVNTTGNPGMATGGMGDVLTGLIAALIAQGLAPADAARLGVAVHGAAADLLARQLAPVGFLAREVADMIPVALAQTARAPMGFVSLSES